MFDARQSNLQDVTTYAPLRILLRGALKAVFGLLVTGIGAVAFGAALTSEHGSRQPGDMPWWWMFIVGAAIGIVGLSFLGGGLGRMVSAFARGCYFKAGPEGLAVRVPKQGWFGRFRVVEYQFRWDEVEELNQFTRSLNLIPIARELHVRLYGGKEVAIERYYFSASVRTTIDRLSKYRTQVGR